uniref:Serine/threonine-protein phosphatase n=1 Tax=Paramecium tetraurelia TaxID=5888 RepID=Q3SCX5_PARTE|nr:calcineurin-A2-2 [Paramecium tetraurelia]
MELLRDPSKDRVVKTLKPPPHRPLSNQLMFPDKLKNKPDWRILQDHLSKEGRIAKEDLIKLVTECNKILKNEGNLIYLHDPLTVVGDIHGQYYDLVKMFDVGGNIETTKYLFLGDFVDRGSFSIEVVVLAYAIKINFPNTVFFLRGNHECRQLTSFFNFKDECLYKYDQETYDLLMDSFDLFPLACVVNNKFLAIHGGISPDLKTLEDIKKIDRYHEPPRSGLFCDILWSDPVDNDQGSLDNGWRGNEVRGCSWFFGVEAVHRFLQRNNLISVIRAHEAQLEGYKMHRWKGSQDFPVVITIFSAPNYCDVYKNKGAVIKFENNTLNIQQFKDTPHPYLLPNFMDVFSWSIPFVTEKVTEMLYMLLKHEDQDQESENDKINQQDIEKFKQITQSEQSKTYEKNKSLQKQLSRSGKEKLRSRLKFVATMMKMQKTLREENESIVQLKGACPDKRLPKGLLLQGKEAITDALQEFNYMKLADSINEKMPNIQIPQQSIQIKKPGQSSKKK